eukprot:TRINITY_DN7300_c0_g1_i1.p1 TRINITY_DN7300_c0_g1~~TRINITY_DN7300_c0_g1_i1.p1  ORF type:complete len:250 (-),score=33.04 TRINITY_DN7300_c0_g1_i1:78-827(-)
METTSTATPGVLGIIGGSNLLASSFFASAERKILSTDHGDVALYVGPGFVFCQRHQADPRKDYTPPHLINKKAILAAFLLLNVKRVIAFASVGALKSTIKLGTLLFPDDWFNLSDTISMFDDRRGHYVPTLISEFRTQVIEAITSHGGFDSIVTSGTYVQTMGPRFETKAEIRFLADYSDVVGMTAAHEATLCGELQLPYALVCMIDNMAHGISSGEDLTLHQFEEGLKKNAKTVEQVLGVLLTKFVVV